MVPPCSDRISRVPPYSDGGSFCGYGAVTRSGPTFQTVRLYDPHGLVRVRSPLLAESLLMSFPPGTEMFQFPGFALISLCIQPISVCLNQRSSDLYDRATRQTGRTAGAERTQKKSDNLGLSDGFPHSEIAGSKPVRSSPTLIAAYHVLHRLLSPRHPPNALLALDPSQ